jgi:hypothetical protein
MTKIFCCRFCAVQCEPLKLADGSTVLLCTTCDLIGVEREVAQGGPMWPAGGKGAASQRVTKTRG